MRAYESQPNDTESHGDVDLRNLADFVVCFTGEGSGGIAQACEDFDANCDDDLDLHDFAGLRLSLHTRDESDTPADCIGRLRERALYSFPIDLQAP